MVLPMNKLTGSPVIVVAVMLWAVGAIVAVLLIIDTGGGNGVDDGVDDDDDHPATENSYLEAAPKDTLFLVEMTSFAFAPDVLEVTAGDVVEIAIQNVEPVLHDFTVDEIDADVHVSFLGGTGQHAHQEPKIEADVHFALTEPGSGIVHLNIHEPGEFVFYCSVPGHRENGMFGTLIVQPSDS